MRQDRKTKERTTQERTTQDRTGSDQLGLRPLTARSVVASLLLGTAQQRLPVGLLVQTATLFGIEEGTTRTALSRMVDRGELEAGAGSYALAGHLADRAARQRAGRRPPLRAWNGDWYTVLVAAGSRSAAQRFGFRAEMARARLAELRDGVWLRPANLGPPPAPPRCHLLVGRPAGATDPAGLARDLWDLAGWARRATRLQAAMAPAVGDLDAGDVDALAPGFMVAAAVLRHINADPLLPPALLPTGWPGAALREDYDRYEVAFQRLLRNWYRQHR